MFRFEGKHILLRKEMTDMIQTYDTKKDTRRKIYTVFSNTESTERENVPAYDKMFTAMITLINCIIGNMYKN